MSKQYRAHRKNIISKALYAKEYGCKAGNIGAVEAANNIIKYVDSEQFDVHDLLSMSDYSVVLRIWSK
jgi:hypothetical protein